MVETDSLLPYQRLSNALFVVDKFVTEPAPIAEKIAVDLVVISVNDAPQLPVSFGRVDIASQAAMNADRRRHLHVPLPRVVVLQGSVCEYSRRADLHQVSGKFIFEDAVPFTAKKHGIAEPKGMQVMAAGVVAIKTHAPVALDAAVHFMVDERAEVLIAECALVETIASIIVPGHDGHILQVAFATFVADRAIMGMVLHQAFDDGSPEFHRLRILYRDTRSIGCRR